jgi:hypothetical protein
MAGVEGELLPMIVHVFDEKVKKKLEKLRIFSAQ